MQRLAHIPSTQRRPKAVFTLKRTDTHGEKKGNTDGRSRERDRVGEKEREN